jgi:hypothetical protein
VLSVLCFAFSTFFFFFFFFFPTCFFFRMSTGRPPTRAEIEARNQAERDEKKKRQAEWTQIHPSWFLAIMRNDAVALQKIVSTPGFDMEQRYVVITDATPVGWATICDRGELVVVLVAAGASVDAQIKFWGNQTWKPKDYSKHYGTNKALHALETTTKAVGMEKGVDFD